MKEKSRGVITAGAGIASAALFAPRAIRMIDSRRTDCDHLTGEGLHLEHFRIESRDGTPLHVTGCGEGDDALFLVHGWTCNESVFRFQQAHFQDRYRVYTLELRGHGSSGIPADLDYHPERLAEDLQAALERFEPRSFAVAGHSLGGFTTFKWFERFGRAYRGRLKGLVIIDSTGTDLVDGIVLGSVIGRLYPVPLSHVLCVLGRRNRISQALKKAVRNTSFAYAVVRWGAFGRRPVGEHVEHVREMVLDTNMTSLALAAKACLDYHCDYYLPSVDVPVSLLVGERDKLTSRASNERTAGMLPDARLKVFEGAGHCAMIERRDDFNREMESFLEEVFST